MSVTWSSSAPSSTVSAVARRLTGWSGGVRGDVRALLCLAVLTRSAPTSQSLFLLLQPCWPLHDKRGGFTVGVSTQEISWSVSHLINQNPNMGCCCCKWVQAAVFLSSISLKETLRKWLGDPAIHLHLGSWGWTNSSAVGNGLENFPNGNTCFSGNYSEQMRSANCLYLIKLLIIWEKLWR